MLLNRIYLILRHTLIAALWRSTYLHIICITMLFNVVKYCRQMVWDTHKNYIGIWSQIIRILLRIENCYSLASFRVFLLQIVDIHVSNTFCNSSSVNCVTSIERILNELFFFAYVSERYNIVTLL